MLDAGCRTGDVTYDSILPILPPNFKRLVDVDISEKMLDYARKNQTHPKLSFEHFDLNLELEKQPLSSSAPFDHIFSFYCLHWIQNQKNCIQTFFKLLNTGGDMLLIFICSCPLYDVYKEQLKNTKWAKYITNINDEISPYHYSKNPEVEFRNLLSECGFYSRQHR